MSRFTLPAAALVAGTLLFSVTASADDRDRSRSDRHYQRDHDNDRHHDRRRDNDRRYSNSHRDYHYDDRGRWVRKHHRHEKRRHYWHDGHYWRHGYVPSYYRGRYYDHPPRDSRGRLIITIPF
jgi:hypothetical protein